MKRKKIKTILCHMAIITICAGVFCHGYIMGFSISVHDRVNVYATDNIRSRQDLIDSFMAYCKSRNLLVNGTILGSATEWTGSTIENIIDTLGIDMDYLQAQISKETSGNLGLRWLITSSGVGLYNRIFSELLQREELEVGDTEVDKKVYSGDTFTDYDGNKCLVYYVDSNVSYVGNTHTPLKFGTPYKYTTNQLYNMQGEYASYTPYQGKTFRDYITPKFHDNFADFVNFTGQYIGTEYEYKMLIRATRLEDGKIIRSGHRAIFNVNGSYYFGHFLNVIDASPVDPHISAYYWTTFESPIPEPSEKVEPTDVNVTTPDDKPIKPNLPENPITVYPTGDTDDDDDNDDPDNWNPTTPEPPAPSSPDFPSVDLPDIDIPDLPSLNFSLGDLRNKFPFSLPFDIIAVLNVLDGEPQAPHIEATVPIGRWYTWEMDFDFSEFDNYARIFRAFEFIGFCIGLAVFTVHFVKG